MISSQSRSVTMKPTLSVSKGQSSDLDMIANDQQIPRSASSEEYLDVPISECISNQCKVPKFSLYPLKLKYRLCLIRYMTE